MPSIYLRPGKEKPVKHHHPWIFSGAIEKVEGNLVPGSVVEVKDSKGNFLTRGYYNAHSQIAVRLLEWQESTVIEEAWWRRKVEQAIRHRQHLLNQTDTNAFRLVNAEADLLPGLIVDKYGDFIIVQFLTAGIDKVKEILVDEINNLLKPAGIYERSDVSVRNFEGLSQIKGTLKGESPPNLLEIKENGFRFLINVQNGQKTGFYLDQRANRKIVARFTTNKNVLDCFAYTGSFGVYAKAASAESVISIDSSAQSLELLNRNYELNGFSLPENQVIRGDVFTTLRQFQETGRLFDLVILDPPKFAPTKTYIPKAQRAYKDLNLLAMKILRPDGLVATFSCSGAVSKKLFQQIVTWAAKDAEKEVQILHRLSQGTDHPVRLSFPESEYLKGLICKVL